MSTAAATSAAAAAAAVEQQRRMREEEEEMTPYTQPDLSQDWEFKILRSCRAAFRRPEELRKCLDEEARAGWTLIEKFDDTRLRLKRPANGTASSTSIPTGRLSGRRPTRRWSPPWRS